MEKCGIYYVFLKPDLIYFLQYFNNYYENYDKYITLQISEVLIAS